MPTKRIDPLDRVTEFFVSAPEADVRAAFSTVRSIMRARGFDGPARTDTPTDSPTPRPSRKSRSSPSPPEPEKESGA